MPLARSFHRQGVFSTGGVRREFDTYTRLETTCTPTIISALFAQFPRFILLFVWNSSCDPRPLPRPRRLRPASSDIVSPNSSQLTYTPSHLGSRNGCAKWAHVASTAAKTSPGPAMPLQDRQDVGRRLILCGERVRAHRHWTLLRRQGDKQTIDGWTRTHGTH